MNRTQITLGGLLVLQLVLIALLRAPFGGRAEASEAHALLPSLEALSPTRIELLGADGAKVNLKRDATRWTVEEAGGFPADETKIDTLLDELRGIRVRRPVVSSSRYHEAFKVADDENEGRVRVYDDASGEPRADLILGDSPNYRIAHVRVAGDDKVYEAQGIAPYDVRAATTAWAVKELVDVPETDIVEVALTNAHGSFKMAKQDGVWSLVEPATQATRKLDQDKAQALARSVATLRMDEPVGRVDPTAHGFAAPAATVELRWTAPAPAPSEEPPAGEAVTPPTPAPEPGEAVVRIGASVPDKEGQRYVTKSGFDFTGTIWDTSVSRLVDQKLDELFAS